MTKTIAELKMLIQSENEAAKEAAKRAAEPAPAATPPAGAAPAGAAGGVAGAAAAGVPMSTIGALAAHQTQISAMMAQLQGFQSLIHQMQLSAGGGQNIPVPTAH
eukprot:7407972-Pyramimonas_sp.AAC.1